MTQNKIQTQRLDGVQTDAILGDVVARYHRAQAKRRSWETLWQDCYDYALPQRGGFSHEAVNGTPKTDHIFDATALDAADQLAASMLANLTPIWSQWFGLKPGPDLSAEEADRLAPILEKAAKTMQDHLDRSNFAVEMHQCYLDLIVGGTASLYFEETAPGAFSAFKFQAIALKDVCLDEGADGYLSDTSRILKISVKILWKDTIARRCRLRF